MEHRGCQWGQRRSAHGADDRNWRSPAAIL
jgi:hypothetical protein